MRRKIINVVITFPTIRIHVRKLGCNLKPLILAKWPRRLIEEELQIIVILLSSLDMLNYQVMSMLDLRDCVGGKIAYASQDSGGCWEAQGT